MMILGKWILKPTRFRSQIDDEFFENITEKKKSDLLFVLEQEIQNHSTI
jgi:hypothetical protein